MKACIEWKKKIVREAEDSQKAENFLSGHCSIAV